MAYIFAPTQEYPLTVAQIKAAFPNTSFPQATALRDAAFAERGYHFVKDAQAPAYDPATHRLVPQTAPTLVNGEWVLGVDVVPLTQEEIDTALAAWREVTSVTPRQFRLALLDLDLLDDVEALVAASPRAVRLEWEYSVLLERKDTRWNILGAGMGKTPEDIDNVFRLALTKV